MAFLARKQTKTQQLGFAARRAGDSVRTRAKAMGHMAQAQGYRAASAANAAMARTGTYVRRNPLKSAGILAGLAGLIGWGVLRRRK